MYESLFDDWMRLEMRFLCCYRKGGMTSSKIDVLWN